MVIKPYLIGPTRIPAVYVVELQGADDIVLDHLVLTGGEYGIYAANNVQSDRLTVQHAAIYAMSRYAMYLGTANHDTRLTDSALHDNQYGVYLAGNNAYVAGNGVFDTSREAIRVGGANALIETNTVYTSDTGIYLEGSNGIIQDNLVYGNANRGIYAYTSGQSLVADNVVYDNATTGIYANGSTGDSLLLVRNNQVYGHDDNGDIGIQILNQAKAWDNLVYGNYIGINASDYSMVESNRIFNSVTGINMIQGASARGNWIYSNTIGIAAAGYYSRYYGAIDNNVIYDNTDTGIQLKDGGIYNAYQPHIHNNTIYQSVGDAVRILNSSTDVDVYNNIFWVDSGYALNVAANSQANFQADYNLYHRGTANAKLAIWGTTVYTTLSDWQTARGFDGNSVAANPNFVDINGADNVLGYNPAGEGYDGGLDDNFYIKKDSPAIDRGWSWAGPKVDITGMPRVDDPATVNLGSDDYWEQNLGTSQFALVGVAQNWRSDNYRWSYTIPFSFPFYGVDYTQFYVSTEGFLQFVNNTNANDSANSTEKLLSYKRIAALWDDIRTNGTGDDIYIDTTVADQITFRWDATLNTDNSDINFAITLHNTGEIEFHYGGGNQNLTPTIGISNW